MYMIVIALKYLFSSLYLFGRFQYVQLAEIEVVNSCDESFTNNSKIYCYGELLEAVNVHKLYDDSKSFVDMPMKNDPKEVWAKFEKIYNFTTRTINRTNLINFVSNHFTAPGTELISCELDDWKKEPANLMRIKDPVSRQFALDMNAIWPRLCRRIKPIEHPDRNSLIYVPHNFIIPGGRFREYYYWDAYWIIKGLIASEMYNTTKAMLLNFASLVERYGFIPNGGRIYYLRRSQPPFFAGMAYEYIEKTKDYNFLSTILPSVIKEFRFWIEKRTVVVKKGNTNHTVFQYKTMSNVERPESFLSDYVLGAKLTNSSDRRRLFQNIASAAESGWDFSSRWFQNKTEMMTIETTNIVPIDLNGIMCWNMNIIAYLSSLIGKTRQANDYEKNRISFMQSMQVVFYDHANSAWFDYNLKTEKLNTDFYAAIIVPMFANCYQSLNIRKSKGIIDFMNRTGALNFPGGVPTTLRKDSNQQWDFPNGWSPLNHMIIEGLRKSDYLDAQEMAFEIAHKWIYGNYKVYNQTKHMWEKYDVVGSIPKPGIGGEYTVQDGFGWTNGAILDLLSTYHDRITLSNDKQSLGTITTLKYAYFIVSMSFLVLYI